MSKIFFFIVVLTIMVTYTDFAGGQAEGKEDSVEMVLIPASEFLMGSLEEDFDMAMELCEKVREFNKDLICRRDNYKHETPQHKVFVDAFYIDTYEVTNEKYKMCVDAGKCSPPHKRRLYDNPKHAKYPVVYVNWDQASAYCKWAGKRLPTEAEWEKAARGTEGQRYPWGDEWNPKNANWAEGGKEDGHYGIAPAGSYEAGKSPYGVYDMSGNVWEWVSDWYDTNYYEKNLSKNPKGPDSGNFKVLRGGSFWYYGPDNLRVSARFRFPPPVKIITLGFRCASSVR